MMQKLRTFSWIMEESAKPFSLAQMKVALDGSDRLVINEGWRNHIYSYNGGTNAKFSR